MSQVPRPVRRAVATVKAYKAVFNSPDGKVVLVDLLKKAGVLDGAHELAVGAARIGGGVGLDGGYGHGESRQ